MARANDELTAAEAVAVAEEVASAVRHDVRNRLAIVRGAAYYTRRRVATTELWASDANLREILSSVEGEVDAATNMLVERLSFGQLRVSEPRVVSLEECLGLAIRCARVEPGREVAIRAEAGEARVLADPAELAVALRCLIENGVEAAKAGGAVEIRARVVGGKVAIDFADDGPGLTREAAEQAMMPFSASKPGHRGLGLNIARRICRKLGGDVVLREGASGTTFGIELPLAGGSREDAAVRR